MYRFDHLLIMEQLFDILVDGKEHECIDFLIQHPELLYENLNRVDAKLIHFISYYNFCDVIDYLVENNINIHERNSKRENAIFYARDQKMIQKLHFLGVSLDETNNLGRSPLMIACLDDYSDKVKWLIEAGADVNTVDVLGCTILDYIKRDIFHINLNFLMNHYDKFTKENQKELKKLRLKQVVEKGAV